MKNLYTFKENSNHVKLFKWLWGVNPVTRYKTMCPYFWSYVGTIIILPLVIIIGKVINPLLIIAKNKYMVYLDRQSDALYQDFLLKIHEPNVSDKDLFEIYKSKCFDGMRGSLDTKDLDFIINGYRRYREMLKKKKAEFKNTLDTIKYSGIGTYLSYLLGILVLIGVGYGIYKILFLFTFMEFLGFLGAVLVASIVFLLIMGCVMFIKSIYCGSKLSKIKFWGPIGNIIRVIFNYFIHGIKIIVDMIKNLYKKSCPIITWEK